MSVGSAGAADNRVGIWQGLPADNRRETIDLANRALRNNTYRKPTADEMSSLKTATLIRNPPAEVITLKKAGRKVLNSAVRVGDTVFVSTIAQGGRTVWHVAGKIVH